MGTLVPAAGSDAELAARLAAASRAVTEACTVIEDQRRTIDALLSVIETMTPGPQTHAMLLIADALLPTALPTALPGTGVPDLAAPDLAVPDGRGRVAARPGPVGGPRAADTAHRTARPLDGRR